jgi:ketosteroid isomerase-like protein
MTDSTSTRSILQEYYDRISQKSDWKSLIADKITFTSVGRITYTKEEYVEATSRFLQLVTSLKINEFIVEDNKACITVEYSLKSPKGNTTSCEVAEVLMVRDGKIYSSCIFFDTASFRSFVALG